MGENDLENQPQKAGLPGGRIMFLAIPRSGLRIMAMWEGTAKDSRSLPHPPDDPFQLGTGT